MKYLLTAWLSFFLFAACTGNALKKELAPPKSDANEVTTTQHNLQTEDFKSAVADSTGREAGTEKEQQKHPGGTREKTREDWDKKIIKTATLSLEVKDYRAYYDRLRENLRNLGGYVAQEEQSESDYKIENTLVIKVPADQFDNALDQLSNPAEKLGEKKISSQDVTGEYVDTRSRLESKKQVRLRYLELLKQARNMEEILNVQSEINAIQEEIEAAEGRVSYLSHAAAFSTINLTCFQVLDPAARDTEHPGIGQKITAAFRQGWGFIVDLFVGLVSIWPLILGVFILVILYRKTRNRKVNTA